MNVLRQDVIVQVAGGDDFAFLLPPQQAQESEGEDGADRGSQSQDEAHENTVILLSNAVVDPGAVVVVALDTHVASRAVAGARRPHHFTLRAEVDRVDQLHQLKEVDLLRPRDLSWVTELSPGPEEDGRNAKAINDVK